MEPLHSPSSMPAHLTFKPTRFFQQAFSLVELSIVLVILGLLVGSILAGQSIIRAAELRKITTSLDNIRTAYGIFRDKYFYLPGDMPNATSFWGALASCPSDASTSGSTATCDGNGDGALGSDGTTNEATRAWQHLAVAGFINGNYSGRYFGGNNLQGLPNPNFYIVRGQESGFHIYTSVGSSNANNFDYPTGLYLFAGSKNSSGNNDGNPITSVNDTWNIDTKIDDGKAKTGAIFTHRKYAWFPSGSCIDSSNNDYNFELGDALTTTNNGPGCAFLVKWH